MISQTNETNQNKVAFLSIVYLYFEVELFDVEIDYCYSLHCAFYPRKNIQKRCIAFAENTFAWCTILSHCLSMQIFIIAIIKDLFVRERWPKCELAIRYNFNCVQNKQSWSQLTFTYDITTWKSSPKMPLEWSKGTCAASQMLLKTQDLPPNPYLKHINEHDMSSSNAKNEPQAPFSEFRQHLVHSPSHRSKIVGFVFKIIQNNRFRIVFVFIVMIILLYYFTFYDWFYVEWFY